MSFITVENISIVGMATAVPTQTSINNNEKFIAATGVAEKRITDKTICTSDLCLKSAEQLINDLGIDKTDIEILIFVSQTPDYKLPVTSTILQHKLGLSQACLCLDIPLGCSGYVYGLTTISSLMSTGKIKKGKKTAQSILNAVSESVENKKVVSEIEKMKSLIGYNQKTQ